MNKIISVYFSGSGFEIDRSGRLANSLYNRTNNSESQISMGFNGCGIDYGFNGIIFGSGIDKQCQEVIDCIIKTISDSHHVTLNVYGHSRGGVAALLLAKQLGHIPQEKLVIHLALLDPVPGNLITTARIDPFEISLANKAMDLTECKPLKKVLVLYPYIPLPAIACHAPLLASYPLGTQVEEEVVLGCHSEAEHLRTSASHLVKVRVEEFLLSNGTHLEECEEYKDAEEYKKFYLNYYEEHLWRINQSSSRDSHSARGVIITATPGKKYLNNHHKVLAGGSDHEPVCLKIEPSKGIFSWFRKFFTNYPLVGQALKWVLFALSVTTLLFFSGCLAAIPIVAPIQLKLKLLSLLVFSPLIGVALAISWYGIFKPILSWCAGKFFYPHYAIRKIEVLRNNISESIVCTNLPSTVTLSTVDKGLLQKKSFSSFQKEIIPKSPSNEKLEYITPLPTI
jgi:hypothetical protein